MADSANKSPHPLVKKVLDSKPPIAKLIDFEVERVAPDTLLQCWKLDRNTRIRWVLSMEVFCAMSPMRRWE